jgi:hypothetical protein
VSEAEAENSTALASSRVDTEGIVQKIVLLEGLWRSIGHRRRLRGSTEGTSRSSPFCRLGALSSAIPSLALLGQDMSEGMWLTTLCHTEMDGELAALGNGVLCLRVGARMLA